MPGIDVSSFKDVDRSVFDGVPMRDASSNKILVEWSEDEDAEEVHVEAISTVAGISLVAASASQASQGRRPPARSPAAKRSRPSSVSTGARGCVSTRAHGSRGREVERLDGSIRLREDLQVEIGKLPIWDLLLGKTGPWKMLIYNAVRPSVLPSSFTHKSK